MAIAREFGWRIDEISDQAGVAFGYYLLGDFKQASALFADGATQAREIAIITDLFYHLLGLGVIAYQEGDVREAMSHFMEMLRFGKNPSWQILLPLGILGKLAWDSDKESQGLTLIAAADALNGSKPYLWFDKEWREILDEVSSEMDDPRWEDGRSLTFAEARDLALKKSAKLP